MPYGQMTITRHFFRFVHTLLKSEQIIISNKAISIAVRVYTKFLSLQGLRFLSTTFATGIYCQMNKLAILDLL